MLTLINNTTSVSRIGFVVSLDTRNTQACVYATPGATKAVGVFGEAVAYRKPAKVYSIGDKALVYVSANVNKGDVIRLAKAGDNITLGGCTVAKTSDSPFLRIGVAQASGKGLIPVVLELSYQGTEGSGYVTYTGATANVNLGTHDLTANAVYTNMPYLMQSDSTDQAIANITLAQVITFDTDVYHSGITRTSASRFTITQAGAYLICFSGIASGATGKVIEMWIRVSGNDIPASNTIYTFKGVGLTTIISVSFIQTFTAGQYLEFWTWGDAVTSKWDATAAGTTPTRPACPSIIMTCNKISI